MVVSFSGIIRETPDLSKTSYPLKVKFISGPAAEKRAPKGTDLGFMDARIHRNKFEINMSSLSHMLSFIEDEKAGIPIPMHVSVSDLTIVLKVSNETAYIVQIITQSLHNTTAGIQNRILVS